MAKKFSTKRDLSLILSKKL